jgi:HTH-type transcriptional regulator/antitoxin HigA
MPITTGSTLIKYEMIKPIHTEQDYQRALKRLGKIFDAKLGTREGDELEILSILIEKYEERKDPIEPPDPIEAIKFRMDQLGYSQRDLVRVIGLKSRVSEILNRKRKLTLDMIRKINRALHIPTEVLVREY